MIFQSMNNTYTALQIIDRRVGYKTYLCSCNDERYILISLEDTEIKLKGCRYFMELSHRKDCGEVCEIFTDKGNFCAVLQNDSAGISIDEEAEDESASLSDRLNFLYRILEDMCIRNISEHFMCDMLLSGGIGVKSDGNAGFSMRLKLIENYGEFDMKKLCEILSEKTEALIGSNNGVNIPEVRSFAESLCDSPPEDYVGLFERYKKTYIAVSDKIKSGDYAGKGLMAKLTKFLKQSLPVIKRAVSLILVLAALGVVIYSLFPPETAGGGSIERIGNLNIEEYGG